MLTDPSLSRGHLLEVAHVAHRLSVSQRYVWRLIRENQLPVVRLGKRLRVDAADLQAFIDARRAGPAEPSAQQRGRDGLRESTVRPVPHAVNR